MGNKDILTLQIGNFSNFVGSHFWNSLKKSSDLNDIIDQEVFFTANKCVSTPRLVAVDLAGSLGSRLVENQAPIKGSQLWEGVQEVYETEHIAAKEYTQYEQQDCVWSDFLEVPLHARSINILPEFHHNNDADPFDIFPLGVSSWNNEEIRDSLENNTRLYAENSDCLQGFHIVLDASNGFAGLASQFLLHLNEEYSNKTTVCFPIFHSTKNLDKWSKEQLINTGLIFESLFENSSMFCPLSLYSSWTSTKTRQFNHINLKPYLPYHASSIIASVLETILLPLQGKGSSSLYMRELTDNLVEYGRKAVAVSCAVPLQNMAFTDLKSLKCAATEFVSLFPGSEVCQNNWRQNLVWRGVQNPVKCQALIEQWLSPSASAITTNTFFHFPCSAAVPFPQFFTDSFEKEHSLREDGMDFSSYGGLHSSPLIRNSLKILSKEISKIKVKQLHRYLNIGMEEDDLLENRSRLYEFSDNY